MDSMRPPMRPARAENSVRQFERPPRSKYSRFSKKQIRAVIITLILVTIAAVGYILYTNQAINSTIKRDKYQAVFLTNGQVYFGKIKQFNSELVKLEDIYYLQTNQNVQSTDQANQQNEQQQLSLAKLGNELHGPEDVMYIDRDQVLFWENLKDDGKVVKAIQEYKKQ